MEIQKQKEVIEYKNVIVGYKCDCCGKEIKTDSFPDEWHMFKSGHNEWGNDSFESIKYYEVCSPECYSKKFIEVIENEMEGVNDGEVDGMEIQFARNLSEYIKKA